MKMADFIGTSKYLNNLGWVKSEISVVLYIYLAGPTDDSPGDDSFSLASIFFNKPFETTKRNLKTWIHGDETNIAKQFLG